MSSSSQRTADALRAHGPEILSFLRGVLRDDATADDAFQLFAERLFRTMDSFAGDCSLRTWLYLLARHAVRDVQRSTAPRGRRVSLTDADVYSLVLEQLRTATPSLLGTPRRDAIARLRDELPEADRLLLVLRVDRGLPWLELARIFADEDGADLRRESARLRKRFQSVKERLRAMAKARALLD